MAGEGGSETEGASNSLSDFFNSATERQDKEIDDISPEEKARLRDRLPDFEKKNKFLNITMDPNNREASDYDPLGKYAEARAVSALKHEWFEGIRPYFRSKVPAKLIGKDLEAREKAIQEVKEFFDEHPDAGPSVWEKWLGTPVEKPLEPSPQTTQAGTVSNEYNPKISPLRESVRTFVDSSKEKPDSIKESRQESAQPFNSNNSESPQK